MGTEIEVYRQLQRRLDRLPIGLPRTRSGVEIRVLKHLFTPEEAALAMQLSMVPEPASRIHRRTKGSGRSIQELKRALDRMVAKGCITVARKDGEKLYSVMPLVVGMYETQVGRLTKDFAQDMKTYLEGEFAGELYGTKIPQMRTIPVYQSVPVPDYTVSTYDNLKDIIEDAGGRVAVINCICRQTRDMIGERCAKTDLRETCFAFREIADVVSKHGVGRAVSTAEALALMRKAQEAGLVVQPENTQHPDYACCCCGDCCGILTTVKKFPRPADLFASNYYAEIESELCTGCETCVELCQLEAITVADGVASVNPDRCIGCGNCVANCEFHAPHLRKKQDESVPPETREALYRRILSKKIGPWGTAKVALRMALRLKV